MKNVDIEPYHTNVPAQNGIWRKFYQCLNITYLMDIIHGHVFKDYIISVLFKLSQIKKKDKKFTNFIYESNITSIPKSINNRSQKLRHRKHAHTCLCMYI